jgi:DNA polymerase-3 subunit epsilon
MSDFKLKTVCRHAGISVDESKIHDAIYDIEITRALYKKVIVE